MLTMRKMVTLMMLSLRKIMNVVNTIGMVGMSQFMIVNDSEQQYVPHVLVAQ